MYFIVGILICIFIFGIILLNLVKIILKQKEEPYKKILNIAIYIIAITTVINIILAMFSFLKTKDKVALVGDRGMKGPKGKKGNNSICDSKCGQKVCYVRVIEHLNTYFSKRMNELNNFNVTQKVNNNHEIKNEEFKNMINKICSSEKYTNIISQKMKKKPNEDKLIKYLEKTIEEWVDLFFDYNPDNKQEPENYLGIKYLTDKYLTFDDIWNGDSQMHSPINIIAKYDIYSWAGNNDTTKLKLEIKSNNLILPKTDEPKLFIMKTNNYNLVYDTKMKNNIWDTTYCKYNQMGDDASNPKKINTCIYVNPNSNLKEYKGTWKKEAFNEPPPLSIYNVDIFKNENNQIFYPVGSVWTNRLDVKKSSYKKRLPKSKNYCGKGHGEDGESIHKDIGPEKETILVSGDVVDPKSYTLLWDNTKGCVDCQDSTNSIKIYRPIPPKGYIALGDVAVKHNEKVEDLKIKCIPDYCLKKISLGPMVWKNENVSYMKFNNYLNYTKNKPYFFKKPVSCTMWSAGASNMFEENRNNSNFNLEDDGGYNLFKIHQGRGFLNVPKNMHAYKIIDKYLLPAEGIIPKDLELKIPEQSNPNPQVYKHDIFFGLKPQSAVITNIESDASIDNTLYDSGPTESVISSGDISIKGHNNEPKRLYLIDDLNKRVSNKSDSFFLKTYSKKKKDYSACLISSESGTIRISDVCDKSNDYHLWNVIHTQGAANDVNTSKINLRPKGTFLKEDGTESPKCLRHYYDSLGKGHYELTLCPTTTVPDPDQDPDHYRFKYDTIVANKMPQYNS